MKFKGFERDALEKFGVRFEGDEVIVPYKRKDGGLWREKVFDLATGERSFWRGESKSQVPYGLETLTNSSIAILTEGESCAWALRLAYPRITVLGLPGASSWQLDWARAVAGHERVYLSFDSDGAGRNLRGRVREDLPEGRSVTFPEDYDTRDVIQDDEMGADYYTACLIAAEHDGCINDAFDEVADPNTLEGSMQVNDYLHRYIALLKEGLYGLGQAGVIG